MPRNFTAPLVSPEQDVKPGGKSEPFLDAGFGDPWTTVPERSRRRAFGHEYYAPVGNLEPVSQSQTSSRSDGVASTNLKNALGNSEKPSNTSARTLRPSGLPELDSLGDTFHWSMLRASSGMAGWSRWSQPRSKTPRLSVRAQRCKIALLQERFAPVTTRWGQP